MRAFHYRNQTYNKADEQPDVEEDGKNIHKHITRMHRVIFHRAAAAAAATGVKSERKQQTKKTRQHQQQQQHRRQQRR